MGELRVCQQCQLAGVFNLYTSIRLHLSHSIQRDALLEHLLSSKHVAETKIGYTTLEVKHGVGVPMLPQSFLDHLLRLLKLVGVDELFGLNLESGNVCVNVRPDLVPTCGASFLPASAASPDPRL